MMRLDSVREGSRLVLSTWYLVLCTWCLALGSLCSVKAQDFSDISLGTEEVSTVITPLGRFAYYVPADPEAVLVMAHGYPWPDDSQSLDDLLKHAESYVRRWQPFAAEHGLILIAPAFGSGDFAGYRDLFGRRIDADAFVNALADEVGGRFVPDYERRIYLYGHSAGGQFAGRFLVAHPDRLKGVVISAPSTYPFPDSTIAWPYGMAPAVRTSESGSTETGKDPYQSEGATYRPDPSSWLKAVSTVPIRVIVGLADTETRSASPGQLGVTRIERAQAWVEAMDELGRANGANPSISLTLVEGIAHDPVALTKATQGLVVELMGRK